MELLTAAQMRAIEHTAIDGGEVTGLELMERAGQGVVEAIFEEWPELEGVDAQDREARLSRSPRFKGQGEGGATARRAAILCGPGNNGGDGFVVARLLHQRGWDVEVLFWGAADKLPPDARANYEAWIKLGDVAPLSQVSAASGPRPVLMIDALLGIGANRALPLEIALAHAAVGGRDVGDTHPWLKTYHVVALDVPSGLDSDSGNFLMPQPPKDIEEAGDQEAQLKAWQDWWFGDASRRLLRCDLAVTFHRRKIAHAVGEPLFRTRVVDLGLGKEDTHPSHLLMPRTPDRVQLLDAEGGARTSAFRMWPGSILRKRSGHKFEHGTAVVFSGGQGRSGAARLAARAALRIGAGLVTLAVPPDAMAEVASQITALMVTEIDYRDSLAALLQDTRMSSFCIGPGLGHARARDLVPALLKDGRPVVLDADALSAFADAPDKLFDNLHTNCVLTPHAGEFQRLFPDLTTKLGGPHCVGPAFSKLDAARQAAARAGCVVLLKGVDTVIADPDGLCSVHAAIHDRSAPWLATAGAGDVLAGMITGLMARDVAPMQAAEVATWLHVECARSFGPGLIAEDLPEELPKVLRQLGVS